MSRWFVRGAICAIGLYALVCIAARVTYRQYVYPAPAREGSGGHTLDVEELVLRARDGTAVRALWMQPASGARVVVHFHGNGEIAEDALPLARALRERGLGALLVEYRGYGGSRAAPSEEGLYLDADAALDEVAMRGVGVERIALWGTSLGTGVAAEMARRGRGVRLVLVSPFTSLRDVASRAVGWLPTALVLPDRYDTLVKAPSLHLPTLIVHGDRDDVVPFEMGRTLASAIPGARFLPIAGAAHGDIYVRGGATLLNAIADHCSR
jgi:fermentation-respiration switch protein FrsA (DUF1100 family)